MIEAVNMIEAENIIEAANTITAMQHSEFPSLEEFELSSNCLRWGQVEQLFHALSKCKACPSLEHIKISVFDYSVLDLSLPVINHFLCFTQLRYLRLDVTPHIDLDNDLLLEAMSSWPHIETLELQDRPPDPT
ncbi:hypothetical protein AZE42_07188, partial [Rhizopogon vesiculosus]